MTKIARSSSISKGVPRPGHSKWCAGLLMFITFTGVAAPPAWWTTRGVLNTDPADDYAAANQGQVKNIAHAAALEMNEKLPGGAGTSINSMIGGWLQPNTERDDFAAVNLGQLKNVAAPFYDRLISIGLADSYPWEGPGKIPDDFAMANIGQVKNLFNFALPVNAGADSDGDGLPDWWELQYASTGLNPNEPMDANWTTPGGLTFLEAFLRRLNPLVRDADGDGVDDGPEVGAGTDPLVPDNPAVQLVVFGFSSR